MGDESPKSKTNRCSLAATALTLVAALGTLAGLSAQPCYTFRRTPPEVRYFDPRREPTREEAWLVSMMSYALGSPEKNDVIFLGDSACRAAIDPARFEKLTGLKAFNLGVVGDWGPDVRLNLAQAYLSAHPQPRLVVLGVSPLGMEHDVPEQWQALRDRCLDCYGFEPTGFPVRAAYLIRQGSLLAWAPRFREDKDIRDTPFAGVEPDAVKGNYRIYDTELRAARGYMPLWGNKHASRLKHPGQTVLVDPVWATGARRLAAACDKAGVPLMIHFLPVPALGSERLDFAQVDRWLDEVRRAWPKVIVGTDRGIPRYAPKLMWDTTHINHDGAIAFTTKLAEDVRAAIGPSPGAH
jgi:hypothetical protein